MLFHFLLNLLRCNYFSLNSNIKKSSKCSYLWWPAVTHCPDHALSFNIHFQLMIKKNRNTRIIPFCILLLPLIKDNESIGNRHHDRSTGKLVERYNSFFSYSNTLSATLSIFKSVRKSIEPNKIRINNSL